MESMDHPLIAGTQDSALIVRAPLRDEVHAALLAEILRGRWPEGSRLRDEEVARVLGVSRTPAREAMLRLAREGVLTVKHGRGFRLRPTSLEEVREIYPIVIGLECMAIRTPETWEAEPLKELDGITTQMEAARKARDHAGLVELDERWHAHLVHSAGNQRLNSIYEGLKVSIRRYELIYMSAREWTRASIQDHRKVAKALRDVRIGEACELIECNWNRTIQALESHVPTGDEV